MNLREHARWSGSITAEVVRVDTVVRAEQSEVVDYVNYQFNLGT